MVFTQASDYCFKQEAIYSKHEGIYRSKRLFIKAKNAAQEDLYNALVRIAKTMDGEWPKNEQDKLKEDAGFTVNKTPERKVVTYVNPPTNLEVYNDKRRGVIVVTWEKAQHAVTTAFEVQQEEGVWKTICFTLRKQRAK